MVDNATGSMLDPTDAAAAAAIAGLDLASEPDPYPSEISRRQSKQRKSHKQQRKQEWQRETEAGEQSQEEEQLEVQDKQEEGLSTEITGQAEEMLSRCATLTTPSLNERNSQL